MQFSEHQLVYDGCACSGVVVVGGVAGEEARRDFGFWWPCLSREGFGLRHTDVAII